MTSRNHRAGGLDSHLLYHISDSTLGRLLVATTQCGIRAVALGAHDAELETMLAAQYPKARFDRVGAGHMPWLGRIHDLASHAPGENDTKGWPALPPWNVPATHFQWRVWKALCAIPLGQTRSYTEVAASLDQVGAARAVGRACAVNCLALIVPCHRVVYSNGASGHWRWGAQRKCALLARERDRARLLRRCGQLNSS